VEKVEVDDTWFCSTFSKVEKWKWMTHGFAPLFQKWKKNLKTILYSMYHDCEQYSFEYL
jgi:hypothetical protein